MFVSQNTTNKTNNEIDLLLCGFQCSNCLAIAVSSQAFIFQNKRNNKTQWIKVKHKENMFAQMFKNNSYTYSNHVKHICCSFKLTLYYEIKLSFSIWYNKPLSGVNN